MELNRLYEVKELSFTTQILHNNKQVRVESVKESVDGDIAHVKYVDSGACKDVPVVDLQGTSLPDLDDQYPNNWLSRTSPIIRS